MAPLIFMMTTSTSSTTAPIEQLNALAEQGTTKVEGGDSFGDTETVNENDDVIDIAELRPALLGICIVIARRRS